MKKFLVVFAAMTLCCFLVRAQEADDAGRGAVLSFIPRIDAGAVYDTDAKEASFSFGNTSFYTIFEGNISQKWSFSVMNHWIASDAWAGKVFKDAVGTPTDDLYRFNGFLSEKNANNFCDWAYITYSPGPFSFSLGKQVLLMGGYEFDDYDFDVNPLSASFLWNSFTCYQWAFSAAYALPDEIGALTLQAAADPFNKGISCAAQWDGTYGPYSMKWSALGYKNPVEDKYNVMLSLGNRLEAGDFTVDLTYVNRCGDPDYEQPSLKGHTLVGSLAWAPSNAWQIAAKGSWNRNSDAKENYWTGGLQASWFPLADSDALRIQALAGINDKLGYALLGITYRFDLKLW